MKTIAAVSLLFLHVGVVVLGVSAQTKSQSTSPDTTTPALKALKGRTLYTCQTFPTLSSRVSENPQFYDITDANDKSIDAKNAPNFFHTGDKLVIKSAETDMEPIHRDYLKHPDVGIALNLGNQSNHATAWIDLEVSMASLRSPNLFNALLNDDVWFSAHPVKDSVPEIGMTREDVICRVGSPEHTNSDELSGDQLVYWDGQMYVYISNRTDRVVNVQTSFR